MTAFATSTSAGASVAAVRRDNDGKLCTHFLLLPDGQSISANGRTGLTMEVIDGYELLVRMAEHVEAGDGDADNRVGELFTIPRFADAAEALIEEGEDDPETVSEILDAIMFGYREQHLIAIANDLQQMAAAEYLESIVESGGDVGDVPDEVLDIITAPRGDVLIDLEGEPWTSPCPLYVIATEYAPFIDGGPQAPVGDNVVLLNPHNETTFIASLSEAGLGQLLLLDDELELEDEQELALLTDDDFS